MSQNHIPASLAVFFQEYDSNQLDLTRDVDTIIERTLRFGNRDELGWLFAYYGQPRIVQWIRELGQYRLPARHLQFWQFLLDIEPAACVERHTVWPH